MVIELSSLSIASRLYHLLLSTLSPAARTSTDSPTKSHPKNKDENIVLSFKVTAFDNILMTHEHLNNIFKIHL